MAVAGDQNALSNLDGLHEICQLRSKHIAKNLKLGATGSPLAATCDSAPAVRVFLLKCLREIWGDGADKYFGGANKWTLCVTRADGFCGYESRGIISGVQEPRDPYALGLVFSARMKRALEQFTCDNVWLDAAELIEDVVQTDPRFNGRVVLVRAIATMNADHKKCSVSLRANEFKFDAASGLCMPEDNGAWPLAARPLEPPQPCHGTH